MGYTNLFSLASAILIVGSITYASTENEERRIVQPLYSVSKVTTCAIDPLTLEEVCSLKTLVLVKGKDKSAFTNATKDPLYINTDLDGDGVTERVPLFGDKLQDYFWESDNQGLNLLQLRLYEFINDGN